MKNSISTWRVCVVAGANTKDKPVPDNLCPTLDNNVCALQRATILPLPAQLCDLSFCETENEEDQEAQRGGDNIGMTIVYVTTTPATTWLLCQHILIIIHPPPVIISLVVLCCSCWWYELFTRHLLCACTPPRGLLLSHCK